MERTGRTAVVALAGLALVGSLLTACATKKDTGTGTLGNVPVGSPGAGAPAGGGAGGSGSGGGATQGTGGGGSGGGGNTGSGGGTGGGGTGGGGGSGGGSGGGTNSPSPKPSAGHTLTIIYPDYSVKATGHCHWIVDAAHHLSLWAEFTISFQGLGTPAALPFNVSNDKDTFGAYGTKPPNFPVTFDAILTNNLQTFSQSAWPGQTVTMTLKISPTSNDHDASNNVATAAIKVPDGEPSRDLLNTLPCTAG